jgi:hypothetical protein
MANLSIDNNVKITVFDSNKNLKQIIKKHNKANRNLVTGLIKFLMGQFTISNVNIKNTTHNETAAKQYIPAFVSFGDGGLVQLGSPLSDGGYVTSIDQVMNSITKLSVSKFSTTKLDNELVGNIGNTTIGNHPNTGRCALTRMSYNFGTSDTITLKLTSLISKGYYSKNFYTDYSALRGANPVYLSELGLWANDFNGVGDNAGTLLARVTFTDEDTIIKQSDTDMILVDWKIDITSIDDIFSENNRTSILWNDVN